MAMEYINFIKAKAHLATATKSEEPVISDEDEKFLNKITSDDDENPPALPKRPGVLDLPVAGETQGNDAQLALLDGSQNIPLPVSPQEEEEKDIGANGLTSAKEAEPESAATEVDSPSKSKRRYWSWIKRDSHSGKQKDRESTATGLSEVAAGLKAEPETNEDGSPIDTEAKKEQEEMTVMLERLNLAAVNNRVFSISDETQELLKKFNIVFRDLINGVPTAYDDLEKLLTNGDKQLQSTYKQLPGFLQKLIAQLPTKVTQSWAPAMAAAAAERAEKAGVNAENAGKAAGTVKKMGFKAPNLKDLIGKPGAVAGMMRTVIQYLRARFPAFFGMNVLWSLAMFIILLVFWYCHKRGRDVRLAKERDLTEKEVVALEAEWEAMHKEGINSTTAPEGASIEEVRAGIEEVREARKMEAEALESPEEDSKPPSTLGTTVQPSEAASAPA
ncbi:MAG: hypothetical protein Q9227_006928 [Pyrenula ochraceoflavens]